MLWCRFYSTVNRISVQLTCGCDQNLESSYYSHWIFKVWFTPNSKYPVPYDICHMTSICDCQKLYGTYGDLCHTRREAENPVESV